MSDIPTLERIFWFHDRDLKGEFPNATNLASQFEICTRTAQRVVDFMRDRMDAPLQYDFSKNGYAYSDNSCELPSRMVYEDEILALPMAKKVLSSSAGGFIGLSPIPLCNIPARSKRYSSLTNDLSYHMIFKNPYDGGRHENNLGIG